MFSLIFMGLEPKETSYKQPKAMDSIHWGRFENPQKKNPPHLGAKSTQKNGETKSTFEQNNISETEKNYWNVVPGIFLPAVLVFLV